MQQNNSDQPPSLSQLLRESYLAEARAQQRHREMSDSEASSSRLQIYTSLKGKAEDSGGQCDPQFPDLSAFLSQEELDKSVNLACQAIGHKAREEKAEVKPSVALLTLSNISTSASSSGPPPGPPSTQPAPEHKELPATHTTFTADRKLHKAVAQQENMTGYTRDPSDGFNDFDRSARNTPYGPETQSKKEFLNKAADFIEELSSLFKANSSKRVRPRVCKSLRSRNQIKNHNDGKTYPLGPDNRECCILPVEVEKEGPSPAAGHKQEAQLKSGIGHVVFQESRVTEEQQHYSVSQEVKEEEAETETPCPAEPSCKPPFFIQKLKSREVPEGSKVQLECIVQGLPVPEVRWFCEGKELENSPDIQIITNGELHSLIIAEAFEEDTGRYSCFASNFYGTDSTSAEIYVEGASSTDSEGEQHFEHVAQLQRKSSSTSSRQTPATEKKSQSQPAAATKELAEELNSPATYNSIPDLLVPTLATTLPVPESSTTPTADSVQEEATPVQGFPTLSPGDTAILATSLPLNSVLPLTQTYQPECFTSQTTDYDYPPGLNSQPIMAAPVFTKSLQDLHASEGQLVVLESRVKGVPSAQVDWFREGKPIQDSPDYRIMQKMGICTLAIAEDSGTCTASNKYGTVSSTAALRVKGNSSDSNHLRPRRIQEPPPVNPQPEATVNNNIKPHSSTIRLDPLISSTICLDPLSTSTLRLDPHSSSMLRPDPFCTSLPSLGPSSLSGSSSTNSRSTSVPDLEPTSLQQNPPRPGSAGLDLSHPKPFTSQSAVEAPPEQEVAHDKNPKVNGTPNHQNGRILVVPLPDPPPNSCLKTGTQTNHKDSRVGLRVHFKLPEDEEDEQSQSSQFDEDNAMLANKEPPPVLAKPKLSALIDRDPGQLQILHNQVLMEQQQEPEFQAQTQPQAHRQIQIQVQGSSEGPLWSPKNHRDPMTFQASTDTMSTPQQMPSSAPPLTTAPPPSSAAAPNTTFSPLLNTYPTRASSLVTSPRPVPQLKSAPPLIVAPVTQMKTIHASHLNLSPAALAKTAPLSQYYPPPAAKLSTVLTEPTLEQITSPTALLRSTHASLMNLTPTSHSFNYDWPKELIATQSFSPVRSPSPVPLLQELAAELNSSAASSPTIPPFSPPATILPTRVLMSPTSPPSLMSSPTPVSTPFLNSMFALRAQSPPQAASPSSTCSTPSPIQNPVAFLSSVLPSLTPSQPTNSMGLPRGAPLGLKKTLLKVRLPTTEDLHGSREIVLHDIEKKLQFKNNTPQFVHQQKLSFVGRPLGPNIPSTVINYDEEYKVSNFEQRLMSEIEFRLERTPVEESDDEVQHDDVPTGKCIAPIFDKKLKNFRAMEGVPVTFSCKVVGIPFPKVYWFKDGKQILRKNTHYKKIREGDGTCALYIECTNNNDDGNYTIMAANPQGRISCSGHLIIQTGPPRNRLTPIHSQRVRTRIQEVEGEQAQEHFFQPHFLQAPGDMLAHEGKLCRLDCKVGGLPNPELMWLINGRPIYPDLYHKMIVRKNGVHSLVIDPLTQNDTGTYTCIASNKAGQSSFCLELKVVEREMKHPPQFVEKLQNMGIPDGTPVRLECRVVGMPPPLIFWKKDNDSILRTKERFSMTQDATGYVCLLIQPTTKDDAGWYTVSAKNEAGIVSCTCRLDIYAHWHQSVPAPMKMAPRAGSRYAALTGQGLDIKSALPTSETKPILFSSSPPEVMLESEEL